MERDGWNDRVSESRSPAPPPPHSGSFHDGCGRVASLSIEAGPEGAATSRLATKEGEGAELEVIIDGGFVFEIEVAFPIPSPGTHPGTRSAAEAGPGPSVTATQPGRYGQMVPRLTFSLGKGLFAVHVFMTECGTKRLSFRNTGNLRWRQSWPCP
jgi:hypothetical protein